MLKRSLLILLGLLLILSGCQSGPEKNTETEAVSVEETPESSELIQEEEFGQVPYVADMLDDWLMSLKNDDLEAGISYFTENCEGRLLGDSVNRERDLDFWRSYLSNMMNLYVDATLEVETVEVNGRGTEGKVIFLMEIEGRKSADDYERRVSADVVFIDGGWKFSRYEELGDRI